MNSVSDSETYTNALQYCCKAQDPNDPLAIGAHSWARTAAAFRKLRKPLC